MSRPMGLAVALVALSAVVAGGVAAKPSGAGSGDGSGNKLGAKSCGKGGWQSLARSNGASFASGAECTAYAAGGGTLHAKPIYAQARALCESFGGTFGVGGPDQVGEPAGVVWVCNDVPYVDLATYGAQFRGLDAQCRTDNDNTRDVVSGNFLLHLLRPLLRLGDYTNRADTQRYAAIRGLVRGSARNSPTRLVCAHRRFGAHRHRRDPICGASRSDFVAPVL
jgi:hypothetical protein